MKEQLKKRNQYELENLGQYERIYPPVPLAPTEAQNEAAARKETEEQEITQDGASSDGKVKNEEEEEAKKTQ